MSKSKPMARSMQKKPSPDTKNYIPEILEDINDVIDNSTNFTIDCMRFLTEEVNISKDLLFRMFLDASECVNDIHTKNLAVANKSINCSNAFDILDFHHKLFDNNYGLFNQYGIQCGEHFNKYSSDVSDIIKYNLTNNWLVKFRNKKNFKTA